MEKYYLGNLTGESATRSIPSKLVELNFKRKPPSFGIVYLTFQDQTEHRSRPIDRFPTQIVLKVLKLPPDQSEATFELVLRANLDKLRVVDFDTDQVIFVEDKDTKGPEEQHESASKGAQTRRNKLECILLDVEANLHSLNLTDGSVKCLQIDSDKPHGLAPGKPIQCQLINSQTCTVHVLYERLHLSYEAPANSNTLRLISSYSLLQGQFKRLLISPSRPDVVLAELKDDGRVLILHNSSCLTEISRYPDDLADGPKSHAVLCSASSDEILLLTSAGSKLIAHSIMVSREANRLVDKDPDQLLPKEPSFELENCWTLDLANESPSLSYLMESEDFSPDSYVMMCPIWSPKQSSLSIDCCWPKYLLVAFGYHLMLLSFEQEPVQPFSVIYDRNFLKVSPMTITGGEQQDKQPQSAEDEPEFIEAKVKPKLVRDIKLIGAKPSDSLFNTLFLVKRQSSRNPVIVSGRHFPQLALVVARMSSGELVALKIMLNKSAKLEDAKKESLYQKLVGDSLRSSSVLLKNQIGWLEETNRKLANQIDLMESNSSNKDPHNIVKVDLRPDDRDVTLYHLSILNTCAELFNELIVVSTVTGAQIRAPKSFDCGSIETIETSDGAQRIIVNLRQDQGMNNQDGNRINTDELQLLIPRYSSGSIEVFSILTSMDNPESDEGESCTPFGHYYSHTIEIKPLQFYHRQSDSYSDLETSDSDIIEIRSEQLKTSNIDLWLAECLNTFDLSVSGNNSRLRLECPATKQFIQLVFMDSFTSLKLMSNDRVALDLIRRTVLRRATEVSLKLEMSSWNPPTILPDQRSRDHLDSAKMLEHSKQLNEQTDNIIELSEDTILETILSECQQQSEYLANTIPNDSLIESELRREIQIALGKSLST